MSKFDEIGLQGLPEYTGFVEAAYNSDLYWPTVYPLYNRIRRSDPEIAIVRTGYSSLASRMQIEVVSPDDPTDDDKRAAEFYMSELENVEGGIGQFMDGLANYVPFMGWGWWQAVPGLRLAGWRPPGDDPWRSEADDGLIGVRRLAFRDHSSFEKWELDDYQRVKGMWQWPVNMNGKRVMLPLENSLHVTFGDPYNPEGLTPLEGVWRLERIKYGYEVVFGIGAEHTAGHLEVTVQGKPDDDDKQIARAAARSILSAQEGNFALWTEKVSGKIVDTPFSAAGNIMEAIRYYGLLKLQLFNMQWVSIASTSGSGAYSAMSDASSMFMVYWNAMMGSFVQQYDDQVGRRLWMWNRDKFPGATVRPRYVIKPLPKSLNLAELASFWQTIRNTMPVGDEDYIEIRKQSGFLPTTLPDTDEEPEPMQPTASDSVENIAEDDIAEDETEAMPDEEAQAGELAQLVAELRQANRVMAGALTDD